MLKSIGARLRPLLACAASAVALMAVAAPAHAEWLRAESPHFIVYGDVNEGELRSYVRKVERFDAMLRLYYPVANDRESGKLEIFLAHGIDDLRKIYPGLGGSVAGFYSGDVDRIFAVVDLTRSEGQSTLFHEYSHHFMRANMAGDYPGWFTEGFAEYYATADLGRDRVRIGMHSPGRMNSLTMAFNEWAPMEAVLGKTEVPRTLGHSYYAQAWAMTHYFMSTPERQQQLAAYLRALRLGGDPVEALQTTVGMTPNQLQNAIRSYVNGRITYFTPLQAIEGPTEVAIAPMARSARDLIWLDLRMDRLGPDGKAEALAQVRERAARYPGDAFAEVVLAKAEIQDKKWEAAEAAVAPLVAADAVNTEALRLTAIARMHRADEDGVAPTQRATLYQGARRLLARAVQADPTDYRIYLGLDESRRGGPGYPTDNDLEVLLAAEEYAPQVDTVRLLAAQALVNKGIYRQAIEILAPVASNPHGDESSAPARALLAQAREKAGLAPASAPPPPPADAEGDTAASGS